MRQLWRREGASRLLVMVGLEPAEITADGRLVPGDIIVGLGGSPVATSEDLLVALDMHEPGSEVEITFLRNGRRQTATAALDGPV